MYARSLAVVSSAAVTGRREVPSLDQRAPGAGYGRHDDPRRRAHEGADSHGPPRGGDPEPVRRAANLTSIRGDLTLGNNGRYSATKKLCNLPETDKAVLREAAANVRRAEPSRACVRDVWS